MKKLNVLCMLLLLTSYCYSQEITTNCFSSVNGIASCSGENLLTSQSNGGRAVTDGNWYYYDNGNCIDAIGTNNGSPFYWGVMFPAGTYSGNALTKVSAFDYAAMNGTVTIYNDGTTSPSNPVGSMNVTFNGTNDFVEFSFSSPVIINPNKNVWVVFYRASGNSYPAAVCANTGNPNGRWISLNGSEWMDILEVNSSLDFTFMVRAYIDNYNTFTEGFENGIPSNWTLIDADGDGHNWISVDDFPNVYTYYNGLTLDWYHNGSNAVVSGSFINGVGALTPNNYLVLPPMGLGSGAQLSFWVAACDPQYAADHFGVFVSTTGLNPNAFTMLQEWTLTGKGDSRMVNSLASRDGRGTTMGTWYNYTVSLNAYSGQQVYIAFRHFNCSDQYIMALDDIQLTNCSQVQDYIINVSATPSTGGTVSGGGTYLQGSSCTVHAVANSGYNFTNWTENGNVVSTNPNYTFNVSGNHNLVAHFSTQSQNYTITVSANPTNGGTASGGGSYQQGQSCTVHATANTSLGYTFSNWTENGNVVSTNANYQFTVNGNRNLVANFTLQQYTITVSANPTAGGTVTGGGSYNQGQSCTVTATANTGYTFTNWKEGGNVVSTQANYTFTVNSNRNLVANFTAQPQSYTITVSANPTAGGTVTGGGSYEQGQSCTVTATANEGYDFTKWTENGDEVSNNTSYSFTVNGNRALVANFEQQQYTITAIANPLIGGSVNGSGQYHYGEICTLTANPNDGYVFSAWTKDGNCVGDSNPSYSFTVDGDAEYIAHFVLNDDSYTINVTSDPYEGGTVDGGGTYNNGVQCTLSAYPNNGYSFENWTKDGAIVSEQLSFSFTVSSNASYVAHFVPEIYEVTASAMPAEGGVVSYVYGTGSYAYGSLCALEAIPNEGYIFVNWTKNGEIVSTDNPYRFTVTQAANYQANFSQSSNSFTISASPNPIDGGTINGLGNYSQGETCTLEAIPNSGFDFVQWMEGEEVVSTERQYQFVVDRNRALVAFFNSTIHVISATAGPNGSISPEGNINVETGESITFTMTPNVGYCISNVIIDGEDVGPIGSTTFRNVNQNHSIHVLFSGVGVEENEDMHVKISPNPAKDKVLVECPEMRRITLYTLSGAVVFEMETHNDAESILLKRLSSGMYLMKVSVEGNHDYYSKLIVSE